MLNNQELYGAKLKVVMDDPESNDTQVLPKGLKGVGPGLGVMGIHLRDVVRQYERYVKGLSSGINTGILQEVNDNNFSKIARNKPGNYFQSPSTVPLNMMPLRQVPNPKPVPPVTYNVGNFRPNGPVNYGPQTVPGPIGHPLGHSHIGSMPHPGLPGPMVSNMPIQGPVGPIGPMGNGPLCPPRQMGPNIPVNAPVGPNIRPVPAPIGPVPRPGNPGVGQLGPVGVNVGQSPSVSPGPKSSLTRQPSQDHVTVELSNVSTDLYLFRRFFCGIVLIKSA